MTFNDKGQANGIDVSYICEDVTLLIRSSVSVKKNEDKRCSIAHKRAVKSFNNPDILEI